MASRIGATQVDLCQPEIAGWAASYQQDVEILIVQLAGENADWGYGKLQGELGKLGYTVSQQTIANILARHAIPPSPQRQPSVGWRHLMQHYKQQILACDFFMVETLFLNTVSVLFFIEVGSHVSMLQAVPLSQPQHG